MIAEAKNAMPVMHAVCDSTCHSGTMVTNKPKSGLLSQIGDFFTHIFNTGDWPPRWHCGTWSDFHGWLYIFSDIAIWAAYFAIPVLLFRIVYKRKDIPFSRILVLFIAFIMLCGLTHLMDAIIFWWPAYRLSALLRFATGVISLFTVYALYKIMPIIYRLRTHDQLEAEIEERKKAEQEARHHQVLQQAAEELMAKKDEFMSIASHELKTPITSVKASLQLLQRMMDKNDALQNVSPFIDKAAKQVDKLTGIIQELLDVTRIQAGKLEVVKIDFNLAELINEATEQCETVYGTHKIEIKGNADIIIHADRNRVEQVLNNLLTNACKYSPNEKTVITMISTLPGGKVKIEVTDKGIGIPEDKIDHIFDRFYRVENTSQYFSGIGLGLYISSEIIKQHDGRIGVTSVNGEGSTFWFIL